MITLKVAQWKNGFIKRQKPTYHLLKSTKNMKKRQSIMYIMAIRVVEFSNGGYKIRKILASESTYSKEIIEF